jgi:ribosome biogenesis GTPase A
MTKAVRMIEDNLKLVDAAIVTLDARAPFSCINPSLNRLLNGKPSIYVLNKADLSDLRAVEKWIEYFEGIKIPAVAVDSTRTNSSKVISDILRRSTRDKTQKYLKKGVFVPVRAMVVGVPNSGKSTVINNFCGVKKAATGDRPGITRGKQWLKIGDGIELLDTPGILWPNLEDKTSSKNLAYIGSIKDDVLDIFELALQFLDDIKPAYFEALALRYKINIRGAGEAAAPQNVAAAELFEKICQNRGFILKDAKIDAERGAKAILDDFRKGRLGRVILETPASRGLI